MNVTAVMNRFLPWAERAGNPLREAWNRLSPLPGGKAIFSRLVGIVAPYTGTIGATVQELRRGYGRAVLRDRRAVRNHLSSVHAIALVNLAEMTGNAALAYSLPEDARFIVAGMSIDYLKKARGDITAECECAIPDSSERRELEVPVTLRDRTGEVVARAVLRSLVGPRKARA
jgi:acyl-coenzyme A thioesterase PaaI-like protein